MWALGPFFWVVFFGPFVFSFTALDSGAGLVRLIVQSQVRLVAFVPAFANGDKFAKL
jgi:hypothetical protein